MMQFKVSDRVGQSNRPLSMVPPRVAITYQDPTYLKHIVRVVVSGLKRITIVVCRDSALTLVHWVKSMRDIGCILFLEEKDVEVSELWLRKVRRLLLTF
jgi:hypothetical protein